MLQGSKKGNNNNKHNNTNEINFSCQAQTLLVHSKRFIVRNVSTHTHIYILYIYVSAICATLWTYICTYRIEVCSSPAIGSLKASKLPFNQLKNQSATQRHSAGPLTTLYEEANCHCDHTLYTHIHTLACTFLRRTDTNNAKGKICGQCGEAESLKKLLHWKFAWVKNL